MGDLIPYGTFPTPYGVAVPVFKPAVPDPTDPDRVLFSMESTAICAGIHDPEQRKRFIAESNRLGRAAEFEDFGGHTLPKVALPIPRDPAYPRIPREAETPIEGWVTGVMDRHRWCDRAEFLTEIIGENIEQADQTEASHPVMEAAYPIGLCILLTAALEHLAEPEIDCIEAAAFYALTEHEEWRRAALRWLTPFRETWFRDWRRERPRYATFARRLIPVIDVPVWLSSEGARP